MNDAITRLTGWAAEEKVGDSMTWVGRDYSIKQARADVQALLTVAAGAVEALQLLGAMSSKFHSAEQFRADAEKYAHRWANLELPSMSSERPDKVRIWSKTDGGCWWREEFKGVTHNEAEAGLWDRAKAESIVSGSAALEIREVNSPFNLEQKP